MRRIYFIVSLLVVAVVAMAAVYECDTKTTTGCLYIPGSGTDIECRTTGGVSGGGGGGPPPTAVPTASPTPVVSVWEKLGGSYARELPCQGGTGDPIGTVFLLTGANAAAAQQLANTRLNDIGMRSGYGSPPPGIPSFTSRDSFRDNGSCVEGDITRGTNDGWHICIDIFGRICGYIIDSRWHVRCIVHSQPSAYGYWASCTPHWDSGPPPSCPTHYVPEVYNGAENYGGSGYDAARDWLWWQLVRVLSPAMTDAGPVFFDNIRPRSQCNGTITSRANSKVNVISVQ